MPDDALADRLSTALDARASAPVDVESLLSGSQRRARQVRGRRIGLGTASVVLVIALPVGIEALRTSGPDDAPDAAVISADPPRPQVTWSAPVQTLPSPRTGVGPATSSTSAGIGDPSSAVVTQAPTTTPAATDFPYAIPDSLAFSQAALPAGVQLLSTTEQSALVPIVHGQVCREQTPADVVPVIGRQWTWVDTGSPMPTPGTAATSTRASVTLTITGWTKGDGGPAFDELVANSGRCTFVTSQQVDSAGLPGGYEGWIATSTIDGRYYSRAVVRIGDLIGGIEVQEAAGDSSSSAAVRKLANSVVNQLTSADFVAPS